MKLSDNIMKFSKTTLDILKNFSSINQSILFKSGNRIRTISVAKNILAEAIVEEEFSKDFGIYDINQFLNGIDLYNQPELDFENENFVYFKEGKSKTKYFFSDPSVIVSPPEKELVLPSQDVIFTLDTSQMKQLQRAAAIYDLDDFSAIGEYGIVRLVVRDKQNTTSNDFSIVVGETSHNFIFNFKVDNIKVISGTYDVTISKQLLSKFSSKDYDLNYYIALEPDSTFE